MLVGACAACVGLQQERLVRGVHSRQISRVAHVVVGGACVEVQVVGLDGIVLLQQTVAELRVDFPTLGLV